MKKIFHIILFIHFCFISTNTICQNTFSDIAPILHEKCAPCHRGGGGAPFSVLNYEEVYSNLTSIYHEVSEGSMPPWAADTNYLHFVNERVN